MSTNFPTALDTLPNPTGATAIDSGTTGLSHSEQHTNANDAIEALQAKVGINDSAVTTSIDYRMRRIENGSAFLAAAIAALTPTGYWRCNETSGSILDSGGGGYNMTVNGTVNQGRSALLPGAAARYAEFTAMSGAYGSNATVLGLTLPLTNSWSVALLMRLVHSTGSATRYLFRIGGSGSDSDPVNNDQVLVYLASSQLFAFWEYSTGTNVTVSGPGGLQSHTTYLVHVVKDSAAGHVTFYLNGTFAARATFANEPSGGSSATTQVGGSTGSESAVMLGEVAFWNNIAHTQSQVEGLAIAAGMLGA